MQESLPVLPVERPPLPHLPTRRKVGRPRKNPQLHSSAAPGETQPVDSCRTDDQPEKNQERHEEDLTAQLREEAEGPTEWGKKRGAESHEQPSDDAIVTKRICLAQTTEPTRETSAPVSESAELVPAPATVELEEVVDVEIDIETVSLTSLTEYTQGEEQKEEPALSEVTLRESLTDEETESSADEIIDVEDHEGAEALSHLNDWKRSVSPAELLSLECAGKWEEDKNDDIDVTGASSPVPDPVIISWTEFSGGEEEEGDEVIDVVGEKADCASTAIFYAVSKGELVSRKCQTEVLSH